MCILYIVIDESVLFFLLSHARIRILYTNTIHASRENRELAATGRSEAAATDAASTSLVATCLTATGKTRIGD